MTEESLFVAEADGLEPTEWAGGPWSPDALQGSAYGSLLVRALERSDGAPGMLLARLSFDLWRPVTRQRLTPGFSILRDGRKARTVEASLTQAGKPVARCTAVFLKADATSTPALAVAAPPVLGPEEGRPVPPHVRAWSPFFTGVDTRVVEGDLLKPGPAQRRPHGALLADAPRAVDPAARRDRRGRPRHRRRAGNLVRPRRTLRRLRADAGLRAAPTVNMRRRIP